MGVHACSCWCIRMAQYYYCCSCWAVDGRLVCWAFMFFRFREWLIGAGCVGNPLTKRSPKDHGAIETNPTPLRITGTIKSIYAVIRSPAFRVAMMKQM